MSAANTIESLLSLGMTIKDAYTKATASGVPDWKAFLESADFKTIEADVTKLLGGLGKTQIQGALGVVQQKKAALLGGKPISALPADKLLQYFDLLTAEGILVRKEIAEASASAAFFAWLVDEALPKLVAIAKVVVPLLV